MKLSDYVARTVADQGIDCVFMVTGGGAMHLNDSFGKEERLRIIFNHHEQACAMAAEGYSRVTGKTGVVQVTTGPGGINALNGVFGAYTDSIPMVVISGQVKRETCMAFHDIPDLRQLGDQEVDIIRMVAGITKYAVLLREPDSIRFHLEKAFHLARSGRPGPCWIDIPIDLQSSQVDADRLAPYVAPGTSPHRKALRRSCQEVLERLRAASRPVIMAGTGVALANARDVFERVTARLRIPVVPAWTAPDVVPNDDPHYCGRTGTIGDRAGNFAVQNADVLLVIGSRLNIRQVSYNWKSFARAAFKIQVDVDPAEMAKPTVRPDLGIVADAREFLEELESQLEAGAGLEGSHGAWLSWCRDRVGRYPVVLPRHRTRAERINPYHFIEVLFETLGRDDVVACGDGAAAVVTFQAARLQRGQRLFANSGSASMGFDLPSAIGACLGRGRKRVICLAGDGSLQMNVQELQTVVHHQLPIKVFVLNNGGYLSIRQTQKNFFGRLVGEGPQSGVSFPSTVALGQAYGIPSLELRGPDFRPGIASALEREGPVVCDVLLDPDQEFEPRLTSRSLEDGRIVSSPLEDLYPFLGREELLDNLLIPPFQA
ncbi:MAG: thiamine pyrophosphate-binding protein [Thermoanaerobaculia bacterium]|nr:thiamine pyrophosphate-binding protein [Thermoanaerobaculia bacterium]